MHIILNSYGATLKRDKGIFLIKTAEAEQQLDPTRIRSISVGKAVSVTSDALLLAIEHQIDVVFVDAAGNPQGRVWSVKYGSISDIRRQQLDFFYGPEALGWVRELVREKTRACLDLTFRSTCDQFSPVLLRSKFP